MFHSLALAGALALSIAAAPARASVASEADAALTTVARWGACLLDTMSEPQARARIMPVVLRLDEAFERKHGQKATDWARTAFGDEFITHYYKLGMAAHGRLSGDKAAHCRALEQRVTSLGR